MKSLDKVFSFLFVGFILFPYIQIVPLGTYNQPYALIMSILYSLINYKVIGKLLRKKMVLLVSAGALIGTVTYILSCFPYSIFQEYKYLITYLSFTFITVGSIVAVKKHERMIISMCIYTVYIWFVVGLIQAFISPSFMTSLIGQFGDVSEHLGATGRGVLSFAPEPTHYGFHMIFLSLILLIYDQKKWLVVICIVQALLLAKSSSAFMALSLAFIIYFVFKNINVLKLAAIGIALVSIPTVVSFVLSKIYDIDKPSRMLKLMRMFLENPTSLLVLDYSVNNRIGAPIATMNTISSEFFIPHGLGHNTWMEYRQVIFADNPWLFALSHVGVPSGIGIVLYQCGFFMIPVIVVVFYKILKIQVDSRYAWMKASIFFIMFNQFTFATPIFCFLLGLAIHEGFSENIKQKRGNNQMRLAA